MLVFLLYLLIPTPLGLYLFLLDPMLVQNSQYLLLAYAVMGLPSLCYALMMSWFRRLHQSSSFGYQAGFALSGTLGALCGSLIKEPQPLWLIGMITGLLTETLVVCYLELWIFIKKRQPGSLDKLRQ